MTQPEFETAYWSHFDGPHRERAALQWAAARDAVSQAKFKQPVLASTLTFKDRINNTLKATKLIDDKPLAKLSKDQRQSFMAIETEAAHQIEEYEMNQLGGKRRATGDEMQTIIDNLVKNRVFLDKNWIRSDPEKVAALVTADEKGLAYVPFDKVPADSRASIENLLKSRGRRITSDVIQRAYAAHLLNDRALFDSIIGGAPTAAANVPVAPAPVPPPLR